MLGEDGRRTDRRDRLIDSATDLLRHHGPNGTGIAAICAGADTGKGVFTHHFPGGKAEVVREVVERNADTVDRLLDAALRDSKSVADAVALFFNFYADLLADDPDFGCPLAAAVVDMSSSDPVIRSSTAASFKRWQDRLQTAHSLERKSIAAASIAADPVATAAVAAFEGAILLARASQDPDIMRRTGAAISKLFD